MFLIELTPPPFIALIVRTQKNKHQVWWGAFQKSVGHSLLSTYWKLETHVLSVDIVFNFFCDCEYKDTFSWTLISAFIIGKSNRSI